MFSTRLSWFHQGSLVSSQKRASKLAGNYRLPLGVNEYTLYPSNLPSKQMKKEREREGVVGVVHIN